jgi:hypothetical protein
MAHPPFAIALLSSFYGCTRPFLLTRDAKVSDFFRFGDLTRRDLRGLIANAVPAKLAFVVVLELLRKSPRPS